VLDSGVNRAAIECALSGGGIEIAGIVDGIDEARVRVHETPDDVLVIAVAGQSERALRLIGEVVKGQPGRPVIVISDGPPDEFTRRVFAAGGDDVLVLPVVPDEVLFALKKALARKEGSVESATFGQAPLVCIFGPKGGTGKTVTATSISVALAELGRNVALVDLDLQFGDVGLCLGVPPETTIFDLVQAGGVLDEEKLTGFMPTHSSGVRLLLAPRRPDEASVVSVEFLLELYSTLRPMVDYVVVDTPPGFTSEVVATIDHATTVCAVGMLDMLSLNDTKLGLDALDRIGFPSDHIKLILNRAGSSVGISDDEVVDFWGREPDVRVPSDREIVRAVNVGKPILVTKPQSEASQAFRKLAQQLSG
jgi:pilus assembly protein CpaE